MKRAYVLAAAGLLAWGASTPLSLASTIIDEPFDYTPVGDPISGKQNNTSYASVTWRTAGTAAVSGGVHQIGSGSLPAPSGFPATVGNSAVLLQNDNTEYDRMDLDHQYTTNQMLYYSLLIDVPSVTGLTTANTNTAANNGVFIGFNNSTGASGTRPSVWGGALTFRLSADGTKYELGVRSGAHETGTGNPTYFTQDLTPGTTYLAVVRYTSGSTAGLGGLSELWINPSSATFGAAEGSVPAADGSATGHLVNGAGDHVDSLILGAGIQTGFDPNQINVDEIRVGSTWADVTSVTALAPEPGSLSLLLLGIAGMATSRRRSAAAERCPQA